MNETVKLIIAIGVLVATYMLTRQVMAWRMSRSAGRIIEDLRNQGAFDVASAVGLPYTEKSWAKFGLRDYDGKALQGLVSAGIVAKTDDGRYFLRQDRDVP